MMKSTPARLFARGRELTIALLLVALVVACDTAVQPPSGSTTPVVPGAGVATPAAQATAVATESTDASGSGQVRVLATLGNNTVSNPSGALPEQASKPAPPPNTYRGCPAGGDGGDHELNARKNRTDSAAWYPVSLASILALRWPTGIETQPRFRWSRADVAEIARFEGIPVQVEGYLAGAKQQGPESCNCHSVNDVDNHLWIVDAPGKSRAQSVVAEITPRLRALHPGWAFSRVQPLVDGKTKVRISGWLMMDQEHPDQVGKTRGTIWEIHPIVAFDVLSGGEWRPLDTGDASAPYGQPGGAEAQPTQDPSLPSPISDPIQTATLPTSTPIPARGTAGGQSTSVGQVEISDIFYNGTKGSNEPDEYVEITNTGAQPISLNGWSLHDLYGPEQFTFNNYTLPSNGKIRVYTNEVHPESGGFSFGSRAAIWSNKGDAAELIDAYGTVVSTFAYGNKK